METILIAPGLRNSGPGHWQTWFEEQLPGTRRIEQDDWAHPHLPAWKQRVLEEIDATPGHLWIVAHSFGCLASVSAALERPQAIRGALLVAPADPDRFGIDPALLAEQLAFPSQVVASDNDPWVALPAARHWAAQWGSVFINLGSAGHINVDSGYGPWPHGLILFEELRKIDPHAQWLHAFT